MITTDETRLLVNEIDTLNKDNQRKAKVILGLYTVILKTGDVELIKEANEYTREAQVEENI